MKQYARTLLFVVAVASACAPARPDPETPSPRPEPGARPAIPAIPERTGPLALDVVYPRENHALGVLDSTFILGSTGTGAAQLTINGAPVRVEANGAYLAFLPVPRDGVYRLQASANGQTATLEHRVRVAAAATSTGNGTARAVIQGGSFAPTGAIVVHAGEPVEVSFRGTAGGSAWLRLPDGTRVPLVEQPANRASRVATYRGSFPARRLTARDTSVARPLLPGPWPGETTEGMQERAAATAASGARPPATVEGSATWAVVRLAVGGDTASAPLPLNLRVLDPMQPRVGVATDTVPAGRGDGYVVGRPAPGTTSNWFWPNGTELHITGEASGEYRVRLSEDLNAWVQADEVRLLPPGTPPPAGMVGGVNLEAAAGWVDARIAVTRRLPFDVQADDRTLTVTVYGANSGTDWLTFDTDPLIGSAHWTQVADRVYRLEIELTQPVWGWQPMWNERGDLVVRIRRPPRIDAQQPLRGITVAVDPGHGPPEGRFGPTRYTEAEANLAISLELRRLLEQAGARVLITRTDASAVPLYERPLLAVRENADLFISVHNNAVGDGVDPWRNHGTSVFYFHPPSAGLASALQRELLAEFGLPDLGVGRWSLAVVRWSPWFPSALTESMFFIIPQQEAALANPQVQERIARAHLRGIEAFLRERAAAQRGRE